MRSYSAVLVLVVCSFSLTIVNAQTPTATASSAPLPVVRDPQANALLQHSISAMASSIPTDSSATGTVTTVEGSSTLSGTIQFLTRGTTQTNETINLSGILRQVVYSNGSALEVTSAQSTNPPLETAVTDQGTDFPLPLLAMIQGNPDFGFSYIGQETLNGVTAQHIQVWNSFASARGLQKLASFSERDIWFDASSGLPVKIAYTRRLAGGDAPSFPVEVNFSNYTNVGGVLYPMQINKSFNGTPWETITIQSVVFNSGLTDTQFRVQ